MQRTLPFSTASDKEITNILQEYNISLTVEEARKICDLLGRDPTITEAVIWGIQGSEHCSYKSSRRFLKNLPTDNSHIILGPKEDAGIVAITDGPKGKRWGLVIGHESHNHPSQIVPYEGAATGIGGVVRDVLCMGARVIGCLDALRLGDLQSIESKTIASEVVRGIGGYGNPLGIPNLGGDTVFDASYNSNCLVNAIALGLVREDEIIHSYCPAEAGEVGYDIIIVGKPTDRSGFGGAAFASISMEEEKAEQNTSAVQEPNPFLERHLLASTYALFDWLAKEQKLDKVSFKDLGAGGVVCASVEQVDSQGFGADIELSNVHVALNDLPPEVIGCSETQERFCWTCHPDLTQHILEHYNETWALGSIAERAGASVIGRVNKSGIYHLTHHGETVCQAKATDITCGLYYERPTEARTPTFEEPLINSSSDQIVVELLKPKNSNLKLKTYSTTITEVFLSLITHPNQADKSPIFTHYDKNVIGNTILEPGEADAGVIAPLQDLESYVHQGSHPGWDLRKEDHFRGVAFSADGNNRYGAISPYWQGINAAVESMMNVAAVGATPRALTDCLNYGNPEIPQQLWALEQGIQGIADACNGVQLDGEPVAVISGNVSLYNSLPDGSSIDPTAITCCVGMIPDARNAVSMQLKKTDSHIILIGERRDECGGSAYYQVLQEMTGGQRQDWLGTKLPKPNFEEIQAMIELVTTSIQNKHILSCHDIGEGGLLLSLFEMTVPQRKCGGSIGLRMNLNSINCDLPIDTILFSQTPGFVVEVDTRHSETLLTKAQKKGISATIIGSTTAHDNLCVQSGECILIDESVASLYTVWSNALQKHL